MTRPCLQGSYYELDRFELSQAELGYLNAYKTGLSLAVPVVLGSVIRGDGAGGKSGRGAASRIWNLESSNR